LYIILTDDANDVRGRGDDDDDDIDYYDSSTDDSDGVDYDNTVDDQELLFNANIQKTQKEAQTTGSEIKENKSVKLLPWLTKENDKPKAKQEHIKKQEDDQKDPNDYIFNYACSILSLGLIVKEYEDAVHEGDAIREEICWKLMLLLFKV